MENSTNTTALSGLGQHLVNCHVADENTVLQASQTANENHQSLLLQLLQLGETNTAKLAEATAGYFGLPLLDLSTYDTSMMPNELINSELVQQFLALPLYKEQNLLYIAVADPTVEGLSEINFLTGLNTSLVIVDSAQLKKVTNEILSSQLDTALGDIDDDDLNSIETSNDDDDEDAGTSEFSSDNAPVVRFINKILLDAIKRGASDIHFEPYEKFYRIRFRLDGVLYETANPPLKLANYIIARLKIMGNLDISERRVPQDGRFKLNLSRDRAIDFRISTCPTLTGEKVVLRILDSSIEKLDVDILGMQEFQKKLFYNSIQQAQGLILVTGPTGSGKTVTLYTALNILNISEKNISSVEDPVEIHLPGINQVPVNLKTGMSFSKALRAFLRQDPDIIMVGEIRDLETAEIAVKASQTGHLVLSTLHTNSAPETLVRLSNMGLAAYNIASSISLIVAQRLVRRLCETCREPADVPKEALIETGFKEEEISSGLTIFKPNAKGCDNCNSGYIGRIGIYEVMPISKMMAQLIMSNGSSLELAEQAKKEGIPNLRRSGLVKVSEGVTSLEELNRVITI